MLLQGSERGRMGVRSHGVAGQLHPPHTLSMVHRGVYFETTQSQRLSSRAVISCRAGPHPPPHPTPDSLMAEIQLLGVRVVVDEKAALDGVQVHLEGREEKAWRHVSCTQAPLCAGARAKPRLWLHS